MASLAAAVAAARGRSQLLFSDRDLVGELGVVAAVEPVFTTGDGVLLEVR